MHIAIIGGGISSLYLSYKLPSNISIDIYEKSSHLGGRINSVEIDGTILETGAGRINHKHKYVLNLIKELKLTDKLYEMPNTITKYVKNGVVTKKIDILHLLKKKLTKEHLISVTFKELLESYYNEEEVQDIIYSFGYDSEFIHCNAYDSLESIKRNLSDKIIYYGLNGGLSQIIDKLEVILNKKKNIKIYKNHEIKDLNMLDKYDKIISCVTAYDLKKFYSKDIRSVGNSLARIYAKFKTPWFKDIGKVTTNNTIRQFIPITDTIAMASYSTNKWADSWNKSKDVKSKLIKYLKKTFPDKNISSPEWVKLYYWKVGAHTWNTNRKYYKCNSDKFIICGEIVSQNNQGWIEGINC